MSTTIHERPPDRISLGDARLEPSDAAGRVHENAAPGVIRRFAERFALIALGLYHIPLFLNNYPSLGGGGFDENGLAARWGHVFTVPGIWVARHVFHMTGPMPGAAQGDNGDVGEEFARLLLAVIIGAIGAMIWAIADRGRPRARWVSETLQVMLRYAIALGLASYAVAKLLPMQFPPIADITLEQRVGDLSPMGLLWTFMSYSRPYALFGGLMELVAVLLLVVRRTATAGALVCLAVMSNVAMMNLAYGVPVKLYSIMTAVSAAVLVSYDVPRLIAVFVRNRVAAPAPPSMFHARVPAAARWTIKLLLLGSVMLSSVAAMRSAIARRGEVTPLDGAWIVTSFATSAARTDSTAPAARWQRLIFQNGGATIRGEDNLVIGCRSTIIAPSAVTLTCSRGRAGELQWTRAADTLRLDGEFAGAHLTAAARHVDRSTYPLLRSRFRWITDR